ncbi:hypothetical protein K504DRAFT_497734 [Pleomassaria siparia CBS 279.74]|uniref:RBR-type E3 ubiquitin transferase n=1 Tax=Pleomassaria siparia CBS 279.74 TaxID=1314801 RepID=A0A6G1KJ90_9PLEO|nr:hypothetical protein K504DRAFT_497734 [Pleomassaria siparia CBS 279.74]
MGSKLSKAVRRPHVNVSQPDALFLTQPGVTAPQQHNLHERNTRLCQDPSIPEIQPLQPLQPLVADPPTSYTATADDDDDDVNHHPQAAAKNLTMDPQPCTIPTSVELRYTQNASDSLTRLLFTDTQQYLDSQPAPPPPPPAPIDTLPPPALNPIPPPPPENTVPEEQKQEQEREQEYTCMICCESDIFAKGSKLVPIKACKSCPNIICAPCLKDIFVMASKDMRYMPPRCCIQIPLYHAKPYLTPIETERFKAKYEEWSTPKPLYCPLPTCSTFIPDRLLPQEIRTFLGKQRIDSVHGTPTSSEIACPKCDTNICTQCRQFAHPDQMCENLTFGVDEETAKLLKDWGYKQCPKCSNGVKRMFGCNHMECLCGANWCWVCQKSNGDCYGQCYEEDDEYSDEDEDEEDEEETQQPTAPEGREAPAVPEDTDTLTNTQPAEPAGSVTTVSTETETEPQLAQRPRNLDAHSRDFWERSGRDFGGEPTGDYADRSWDCTHRFGTTKVNPSDSPTNGPSITIECTKCWNVVHPEVEMTSTVRYESRMVSDRGYPGRGRATRGRGRGTAFQPQIVRGDVTTVGPATTEAINTEHIEDICDRTITTTEVVDMEERHRASLDAPTHTDRPSALTSPAWVNYTQSQHSTETAYECHRCGIILCSTCKDEAIQVEKEREEREEREAVAEAIRQVQRDREQEEYKRQEAIRQEAERLEEERLYELDRPQREARQEAERLAHQLRWDTDENQRAMEVFLGNFHIPV